MGQPMSTVNPMAPSAAEAQVTAEMVSSKFGKVFTRDVMESSGPIEVEDGKLVKGGAVKLFGKPRKRKEEERPMPLPPKEEALALEDGDPFTWGDPDEEERGRDF